MTEKLSQNELLSLTTEIVASHLSNNTVAVSDIPQLIKLVYGTLSTQGREEEKEQPEKPVPVGPVKKSGRPGSIICPAGAGEGRRGRGNRRSRSPWCR